MLKTLGAHHKSSHGNLILLFFLCVFFFPSCLVPSLTTKEADWSTGLLDGPRGCKLSDAAASASVL